jgi:dihydroorotate dehydrogenase electron transfer subunit
MSLGAPDAELLERGPARRRLLTVSATDRLGLYSVLRVADPDGPPPVPGQFAMLAAAAGRREDGSVRARAFSIARWCDGETQYLIEGVGGASGRLCQLQAGETLWVLGPLGRGFTPPGRGRRAILVGGGVGIAPLVILQDTLESAAHATTKSNAGTVVLLGFRDGTRALAATLLPGSRAVTDDGSRGRRGRVTDLLARELDRDDDAVVYACGPPGMLEAVRAMCAVRGVPGQLALAAQVACGFGACDSCWIPRRDGGHLRVCVDGPVVNADEVGCLARAEGSP